MSLSAYENHEDSLDLLYEHEYIEETSQEVWEHCVIPSTASIFHILYKILIVNLLFGIVISTISAPKTVLHIYFAASGIYLISNLESNVGKCLIFIFFTSSYIILRIGSYIQDQYYPTKKNNGNKIRYLSTSKVVKYTLILILVLCQYFLLKSETWMEIRGVIMVFSMKLISIAEDVERGVIKYPSYLKYYAYICCGANVMFGPWISFQEYEAMFHQPTKKNIWWIFGIARALLISMFFLMVSNCWSMYFIPEDSNRWLTSYREAFSFRASHYFISFLSEASMLAAGYKNTKIWHEPKKWHFEIADPLKIEFPSALAVVVTTWNKPMHDFLKKYVYRSWLPSGKFYGILATFVISSFLHGFEFKVSVVLILIGIFSYLQFTSRDYFAKAFSCCIRVYPCKNICSHRFKRNSIVSWLCRLVFSFTTIVHLVYLGMLMDPSTDETGIFEKWKQLYFVSFWIMLINMLVIM